MSAKEQFDAMDGPAIEPPLERLRFFCLLALNLQDWQDVESLFDAAQAHASKQVADVEIEMAAEREAMRALLQEVNDSRWECATEDGDCPDCGCEIDKPHDRDCLLGRIDAAIRTKEQQT